MATAQAWKLLNTDPGGDGGLNAVDLAERRCAGPIEMRCARAIRSTGAYMPQVTYQGWNAPNRDDIEARAPIRGLRIAVGYIEVRMRAWPLQLGSCVLPASRTSIV